jgi:hypothetical protein
LTSQLKSTGWVAALETKFAVLTAEQGYGGVSAPYQPRRFRFYIGRRFFECQRRKTIGKDVREVSMSNATVFRLAAAIAGSLLQAYAQQPLVIMSGSASLASGVKAHFATTIAGNGSPSGLIGATRMGSGKLHRYIIDAKSRVYAGYDLEVETMQGSNSCRVNITPLTLTARDLANGAPGASGHGGASGAIVVDESYRERLLPNYPGTLVATKNDTITFELPFKPGEVPLLENLRVSCGAPLP